MRCTWWSEVMAGRTTEMRLIYTHVDALKKNTIINKACLFFSFFFQKHVHRARRQTLRWAADRLPTWVSCLFFFTYLHTVIHASTALRFPWLRFYAARGHVATTSSLPVPANIDRSFAPKYRFFAMPSSNQRTTFFETVTRFQLDIS